MPKMKAYASFDLYLADQPAKNQRIIRALRAFVKRTSPELTEFVKWGNGCWVKGKLPVAYVYSDTDYVQFGFIQGSALADPKRLLEGKGQYVRHVKVRALSDIDEASFAALLRQAAQFTSLPSSPAGSRRSKAAKKPSSKPKSPARRADGARPARRRSTSARA